MLMLTCQMHGSGLSTGIVFMNSRYWIHWICRFPFSLSRAPTPSASLHRGVLLLHGPPTIFSSEALPTMIPYIPITYLTYLKSAAFSMTKPIRARKIRKAKHCIVNSELLEIRCHAACLTNHVEQLWIAAILLGLNKDGPRFGAKKKKSQRLGVLAASASAASCAIFNFSWALYKKRNPARTSPVGISAPTELQPKKCISSCAVHAKQLLGMFPGGFLDATPRKSKNICRTTS